MSAALRCVGYIASVAFTSSLSLCFLVRWCHNLVTYILVTCS